MIPAPAGECGASAGSETGASMRAVLVGEKERESESGGSAPASVASSATPHRPGRGAAPVRLPDGGELPGDLLALLDQVPGGLRRVRTLLQRLTAAGFVDTRGLLELPAGRVRYQGHGLNDADERDLEAHLRSRWGAALGALAPPPNHPHASGPGPRPPTQADRRRAGLNALHQAAARLAANNSTSER